MQYIIYTLKLKMKYININIITGILYSGIGCFVSHAILLKISTNNKRYGFGLQLFGLSLIGIAYLMTESNLNILKVEKRDAIHKFFDDINDEFDKILDNRDKHDNI